MRNREYLAALRPYKKGLLLTTLYFENEINDFEKVPNIENLPEPNEEEIELAKELIDKLSNKFDISEYEDTYRNELKEIIEKKAKGKEIEIKKEGEIEKTENISKKLKKSLETT